MTKRELVRQFLLAWWDSIARQSELMPYLAETLGTEPSNVYYQKAFSPAFEHTGSLRGTKWRYFFHGLADCDLKHEEDGRFVQISFGPHGRFDTFSGWETMLYIMASKSPWPKYAELKGYLAGKPPPYDYLSGSHHKMMELIESIGKLGLFEVADKELTSQKQEFRKKFGYIDSEGRHVFPLPAPYNDYTRREFWDMLVCDKWVLSEQGQELFTNHLETTRFSKLWDAQADN